MRRAVVTRKDETVIKPITDEYIERIAGITSTKGKLLNAPHSIRTKSQEQT